MIHSNRKIDILLKSTVKLIQENLKEEKDNNNTRERKLEALIDSLELDKSIQEMIKVILFHCFSSLDCLLMSL